MPASLEFHPPPHERVFIVNLGRSGSSLLSAILADANADFGLTPPRDWDPRSGQMETRSIKLAAHHYRRAYDISAGLKFLFSPILEIKYRRALGRYHLRKALAESRYLKISDLDLVVQPSFKLGFEPRIVLNYRRFESMLPSLLVGRTHAGTDELAVDYVRIYRQGVELLHAFGGCVVAYDELQNLSSTTWATVLAATTGLDRGQLLAARQERLNGIVDSERGDSCYPEAAAVFAAMERLKGQLVPRSRQVQRALDART